MVVALGPGHPKSSPRAYRCQGKALDWTLEKTLNSLLGISKTLHKCCWKRNPNFERSTPAFVTNINHMCAFKALIRRPNGTLDELKYRISETRHGTAATFACGFEARHTALTDPAQFASHRIFFSTTLNPRLDNIDTDAATCTSITSEETAISKVMTSH